MGIGIVLLFWGIVGLIGATLLSLFTMLVSLPLLANPHPERRRSFFLLGCLPFLGLLYLGVAFIGYALFCEAVRGVDPGIGDYWEVPLGEGYHLSMVDDPSNAFIQGGHHYIDRITEIALIDGLVAGKSDGKQANPRARDATSGELDYFLIDTVAGTELWFPDLASLQFELSRRGYGVPKFTDPDTLYLRLRWTLADLIAVIVILAIPVAVLYFAARRRTIYPSPPLISGSAADQGSADRVDPAEARLFSRYLLGVEAATDLAERYADARRALAPRMPPSDGLPEFALRHPWALGPLDAAAALFAPKSALRRRLALMAAILEADPRRVELFLPEPLSTARLAARLAICSAKSALALAAGVAIYPFARRARR